MIVSYRISWMKVLNWCYRFRVLFTASFVFGLWKYKDVFGISELMQYTSSWFCCYLVDYCFEGKYKMCLRSVSSYNIHPVDSVGRFCCLALQLVCGSMLNMWLNFTLLYVNSKAITVILYLLLCLYLFLLAIE